MNKFKVAIAALFAFVGTASAQDYSLSASGWTNGPAGTSSVTGTQTINAGGTNWAISPYTGSTMVRIEPTNPTATYSNMTSALGMSAASVSALSGEIAAQNPQGGGNITNAAWIYKDFPLAAATKFSMYWVYTSTDYVPFNDGSITTFVNTGNAAALGKINNVLTQYILLGATNPGTGNYSTGSYGSTGWQIVNYEAVDAGTYRLGFASFNQGDTALSPILNVNDGLGTVTKNGTTFGAVAPNNPNMPTVNPTPSAPTVVSTTSTTPVVTSSTTYGTPTTATLVATASTNTGSLFNVTKTTTPVTATPYTITTVSTPKVIQTWSDNTTTTITDPNNSATTTTQNGTSYQTGASSASTKTVSSAGSKNAIKYTNMNLFLTDPLAHNDGVWGAPIGSKGGKSSAGGGAIGYQNTVDGNTYGFAVSYTEGSSKDLGSKTISDSTAANAYIISRQPYLWFKANVGYSSSNHQTNVAIPEFNLANNSKIRQNNVYGDLGVYSPVTFGGFRPLAGVLFNTWSINGSETGSPLLSSLPANDNKSKASPYVGARYEVGKKTAIETKIVTNTEQKTIISNKITVAEEIMDGLAVTATLGFDKGLEQKYNNVYGLVGLKWTF
jgi:hypothetical protein